MTKNKSNPKKTRQSLKQILPTNMKQAKFCDLPTKLRNSNNTSLKNPVEILESFNNYFVNMVKHLVEKIPQTHHYNVKCT